MAKEVFVGEAEVELQAAPKSQAERRIATPERAPPTKRPTETGDDIENKVRRVVEMPDDDMCPKPEPEVMVINSMTEPELDDTDRRI